MKFSKNFPKNLVYGPLHSRRVGYELGINPLHRSNKWCPFNCPYCQDGATKYQSLHIPESCPLPTVEEICAALEEKLQGRKNGAQALNGISICGNGEPTLHPNFPKLVDEVIKIRDKFCPEVRIGVFSTGATLENSAIFQALLKLDSRYIKLDAGCEETFRAINAASQEISFSQIVAAVETLSLAAPTTIQTMFVRGLVDNSGSEEIDRWMRKLQTIQPVEVHIYSIARKPVDNRVARVEMEELERIAQRARLEYNLPVWAY